MKGKPLRPIRWKAAAEEDLLAIIDYIAADSPRAAERFLDEILRRIDTLAEFPLSGSVCPYYTKARQFTYGSYIVYYTVSSREVMIRAIVHGARLFRPAWMRRK